MANPWDPPADLSGGFFINEYTKANMLHRQQVHVLAFNASTLDYTSPPGLETNVEDTITAWNAAWADFYDDGWTMVNQSIWQVVSNVATLLPIVSSHTATGTITGGSIVAPALLSGSNIFNWRTGSGRKGKFVFIAPNGWDVAEPFIATHTSGGPVGGLMTYLISTDSAIRFRDGSKPIDYATVTSPINMRLRRHYHED
jgi:hypothetical protein